MIKLRSEIQEDMSHTQTCGLPAKGIITIIGPISEVKAEVNRIMSGQKVKIKRR